jgi:hypothetical protein
MVQWVSVLGRMDLEDQKEETRRKGEHHHNQVGKEKQRRHCSTFSGFGGESSSESLDSCCLSVADLNLFHTMAIASEGALLVERMWHESLGLE